MTQFLYQDKSCSSLSFWSFPEALPPYLQPSCFLRITDDFLRLKTSLKFDLPRMPHKMPLKSDPHHDIVFYGVIHGKKLFLLMYRNIMRYPVETTRNHRNTLVTNSVGELKSHISLFGKRALNDFQNMYFAHNVCSSHPHQQALTAKIYAPTVPAVLLQLPTPAT